MWPFHRNREKVSTAKVLVANVELGDFKLKVELPTAWLPQLQQMPARVGALLVSHVMAMGMTVMTVNQLAVSPTVNSVPMSALLSPPELLGGR